MRTPITRATKTSVEKVKKSIWQTNATHKEDDKPKKSTAVSIIESLALSKSQKQQKTRQSLQLKPTKLTTLSAMSTTPKPAQKENCQQKANMLKTAPALTKTQPITPPSAPVKIPSNFVGLLGQLQSYEKLKMPTNLVPRKNRISTSFNTLQDPIIIEEDPILQFNRDLHQPLQSHAHFTQQQQEPNYFDLSNRILPLCDISNIPNINQRQESDKIPVKSYFPQHQSSQQQQLQHINQQQQQQQQTYQKHQLCEFNSKSKYSLPSLILNKSSASTNASASSMSQELASTAALPCSSSSFSVKLPLTHSQKQEDSLRMNEHLEGYKVFQKQNKIFTIKIFKEDFMKIPDEFAKVITLQQDDDVSSDDDVVKRGVKMNYKSILKEVYPESQQAQAFSLKPTYLNFK